MPKPIPKSMSVVYELPVERFAAARPLFADATFDEACYESAFLGWQEALLFVDDPVTPRAALLCRSYEYFAAGDPTVSGGLSRFVADAPGEPGVFQHLYSFAPLTQAWEPVLLAAHPLEIIGRNNFRWVPGTPVMDWRARMAEMNNTPVPTPPGASGGKPAQIRIEPLDRALAERADLPESEIFPAPFVRMWWGYDRYAAHGYGFALMIGETFASICVTISTSPRDAIISIDTAKPYWRRGYGALVSAAFIEETLRRGLLPVWDTDEDNIRSQNLARKLGFVERQPFRELAMPRRTPLPLSTGLWRAEAGEDGITLWRRAQE